MFNIIHIILLQMFNLRYIYDLKILSDLFNLFTRKAQFYTSSVNHLQWDILP